MDGSQIHKVIEFTLDRLQGKAGLVHDLSLIKGTTVINDKEPQNSDSGNRSSALALFSWTKRLEKNNDLKIKSEGMVCFVYSAYLVYLVYLVYAVI